MPASKWPPFCWITAPTRMLPMRAVRPCTRWLGCESRVRMAATAWENDRTAPPLPTGNMTALELAKALLEHGANPNVRIN